MSFIFLDTFILLHPCEFLMPCRGIFKFSVFIVVTISECSFLHNVYKICILIMMKSSRPYADRYRSYPFQFIRVSDRFVFSVYTLNLICEAHKYIFISIYMYTETRERGGGRLITRKKRSCIASHANGSLVYIIV